uniref:Putative secreted protein n=1 Tax=Anopheles darlingi TaxID=43151 RepID=A0A2M4DE30_ANODA
MILRPLAPASLLLLRHIHATHTRTHGKAGEHARAAHLSHDYFHNLPLLGGHRFCRHRCRRRQRRHRPHRTVVIAKTVLHKRAHDKSRSPGPPGSFLLALRCTVAVASFMLGQVGV